jgi:hypothetical protein
MSSFGGIVFFSWPLHPNHGYEIMSPQQKAVIQTSSFRMLMLVDVSECKSYLVIEVADISLVEA